MDEHWYSMEIKNIWNFPVRMYLEALGIKADNGNFDAYGVYDMQGISYKTTQDVSEKVQGFLDGLESIENEEL